MCDTGRYDLRKRNGWYQTSRARICLLRYPFDIVYRSSYVYLYRRKVYTSWSWVSDSGRNVGFIFYRNFCYIVSLGSKEDASCNNKTEIETISMGNKDGAWTKRYSRNINVSLIIYKDHTRRRMTNVTHDLGKYSFRFSPRSSRTKKYDVDVINKKYLSSDASPYLWPSYSFTKYLVPIFIWVDFH